MSSSLSALKKCSCTGFAGDIVGDISRPIALMQPASWTDVAWKCVGDGAWQHFGSQTDMWHRNMCHRNMCHRNMCHRNILQIGGMGERSSKCLTDHTPHTCPHTRLHTHVWHTSHGAMPQLSGFEELGRPPSHLKGVVALVDPFWQKKQNAHRRVAQQSFCKKKLHPSRLVRWSTPVALVASLAKAQPWRGLAWLRHRPGG